MKTVNLDGFIEVECPIYNQRIMRRNGLDKSPGLKVQVFLGELESKSLEEEYDSLRGKYTKIACELIRKGRDCECSPSPCEYAGLTIRPEKKE
jgi:hypothetical protein